MLKQVPICSKRLLASKTTGWGSGSFSIRIVKRRASSLQSLRSLSTCSHHPKAISVIPLRCPAPPRPTHLYVCLLVLLSHFFNYTEAELIIDGDGQVYVRAVQD